MMQLSEELTSTENKVAFARQAYNDAVMAYNNKRESVPEQHRRRHVRVRAGRAARDRDRAEKREAPAGAVQLSVTAPGARMDFFERQAAHAAAVARLVVLFVARRGRDRGRGRPRRGHGARDPRRAGRRRPAREPGHVRCRDPGWCVLVTTVVVAGHHRDLEPLRAPSRCAAAAARSRERSAARASAPTPPTRAAPAAQRRRGDGDRLRRAGAARCTCSSSEAGINAFAAGYTPGERGDRGHARRAGHAQPRRAAGRDRARVQPRPQRRHAAQHPPDRAAVRPPR